MDAPMVREISGKTNGGTLAGDIARLHRKLGLFERKDALSKREYDGLMKLLELHAFQGEWDRVVELSSQGIVLGVEPVCELRLYRVWLEALKEEHHVEALRDLARHLRSRRREGMEFVALGMVAAVYSGQMVQSRVAFGHLFRLDAWSSLVAECIGTYLCESPDRTDRVRGLKMLARANRRPLAGYFSLRSMLNYAFETDAMGFATKVLQRVSQLYPRCPDGLEVACMVSLSEGDWLSAEDALEALLSVNPQNPDWILWNARCLEMRGLKEEARDFLVRNADIFDTGDYEFNVAMGMLGKALAEEAGLPEMRASAGEYLERALEAAPLFHVPEQPLVQALEELGVYSEMDGTREDGSQRYWLLSVDARTLTGLLSEPHCTLRCPLDLDKGDVIFFSVEERSRDQKKISGFFRAETPVTLDRTLGPVIRLGEPIVFETDVAISPAANLVTQADAFGSVNFSKNRRAFFFEVEKDLAETIVTRIEGHDMEIRRAG